MEKVLFLLENLLVGSEEKAFWLDLLPSTNPVKGLVFLLAFVAEAQMLHDTSQGIDIM